MSVDERLKCGMAANVIAQDHSMSIAGVEGSDTTKSLLTGCVPKGNGDSIPVFYKERRSDRVRCAKNKDSINVATDQ